jgi:hypothetical protein
MLRTHTHAYNLYTMKRKRYLIIAIDTLYVSYIDRTEQYGGTYIMSGLGLKHII